MTKAPADPYADFRNWLWLVWTHLQLPSPTPVQYDIAQWLQHGPRRSIIQAFRGIGKSWITAAYVTWRLRQNPNVKIMVVSAAKDRADAFSTFVKRLIAEMPELAHLKSLPGQRDSMVSFDVGPAKADQSPSVKSVGILGQLTGSRADEIIADDVEVPNNSETQGQRDKIRERVKEFDAVLKPGGRVIYLGTPQTEDTLYAELQKRGYTTCVWPARVPTPKQGAAYNGRLAPFIEALMETRKAGTSVEPARFHDEDLMEREVSYGRAGFQLQFMLDPSLSDVDRYPLKLSDFVVMDCNPKIAPARIVWASGPEQEVKGLHNVGLTGDRWNRPLFVSKSENEWADYSTTVMFIDPSGRGADEASYAILSFLHGNLFLRKVGGFSHGYSPDSLMGFAKAAKEFAVNLVITEANYGDGMFTELLKPVLAKVHPCGVEEVKHSRQKELRIIDTLEPALASHRLIVDPKVIQEDFESVERYPLEVRHHYRLFHQLTRITRQKGALRQDGRLDALSGAVAYFAEKMARDQDKAAKELEDEALQKELDALIRACGGTVNGDTWVSV